MGSVVVSSSPFRACCCFLLLCVSFVFASFSFPSSLFSSSALMIPNSDCEKVVSTKPVVRAATEVSLHVVEVGSVLWWVWCGVVW